MMRVFETKKRKTMAVYNVADHCHLKPISGLSVFDSAKDQCGTELLTSRVSRDRSDEFESVDSFLRHCETTRQKGGQVKACNPAPLRQFERLEGTRLGFNIHWHVGTINHAYLDNPLLLLADGNKATGLRPTVNGSYYNAVGKSGGLMEITIRSHLFDEL